jgi:hypothetical protein
LTFLRLDGAFFGRIPYNPRRDKSETAPVGLEYNPEYPNAPNLKFHEIQPGNKAPLTTF